MLDFHSVRAGIIEGGIAFLLLFAPFAFGGVETWAQGVIQIVCGAVFVAWVWRYDELPPDRSSFRVPGVRLPTLRGMWVVFGLFVALVIFQLIPLPASWVKSISPATHALYSRTLPGYAQGEAIAPATIPVWLASTSSTDDLAAAPAAALKAGRIPAALGGDRPASGPARRTLSVYSYQTRQNLALLLCYAGIFVVVVAYFRTRVRLQRLLDAVVAVAFLVTLFGILQKFSSNGLIFWVRAVPHTDFFGPFVNRNTYAAFAGTVLPVALGMFLAALNTWRRGNQDMLPRTLVYGFAAAILATGVGLSLSRGGMIAVSLSLMMLVVWLLLLGRRGPELGVLGVLVVAAGASLLWLRPGEIVARVETLSQGLSTPTFAMRVEAWKRALVMAGDYLLVGTGLGSFRFAFLGYAPPGKAWWTTAHNEYLEIVCDTGLLGGLLVGAGLVLYIRRVLRPWVLSGRTAPFTFAGLVSGLTGLLIHSAVSSNLQVPANSLLLVVLAASLVTLVTREEAQMEGQKRHLQRAQQQRQKTES
ncbi:MAG: O-antigen ligase family protein [Acidobacteria bacterium]|nr:O-antigen ligase family protein [Acidobacteriota bacterium]